MNKKLRLIGDKWSITKKNFGSLPIYFGAYASINATGIFKP